MCIRDRHIAAFALPIRVAAQGEQELEIRVLGGQVFPFLAVCLLYTSDAADERSSVDLGGRRIIKKKNNGESRVYGSQISTTNVSGSPRVLN